MSQTLSPEPQAKSEATPDFAINLGATDWNDGSDFWRLAAAESEGSLAHFTPRTASWGWESDETLGGSAAGSRSDDSFALSIGLNESLGPLDLGLSGGYRATSGPRLPHEVGASGAAELEQYKLNLNLGYAGFVVSGAYSREYSGYAAEGDIWDAGIAYGTGPWTFGVNYLYGSFRSAAPALQGDEQMTAVAGAVSYSLGPSFTARAQLSHAEWQDGAGFANSGTSGILGFHYNF